MGSALIGGLAGKDPHISEKVRFFDSDPEKRRSVSGKFKVESAGSGSELAEWADVIVIAVKPADVKKVLLEIRGALAPLKLLVSVAAGVSVRTIEKTVDVNIPVVRAMPNTPAVIGLGMIVISAGKHAGEEHLKRAEALFSSAGEVIRIEEEMMDAATAVSGSGPAYLFYLAEAMEAAAAEAGFSRESAEKLVRRTLLGASAMLLKDGAPPFELISRVASPGGTTEAAISTLEAGAFAGLVKKAVNSARDKSREIRERISTSE